MVRWTLAIMSLAFCAGAAYAADSITVHGADGAKAAAKDGVWTLARENGENSVQVGLRGMFKFKTPVDAGQAIAADAFVCQMRLPKDAGEVTLQLRWHAGASHLVEGGRVPVPADGAFHEIAVPVPGRAGLKFGQLQFFLHTPPDQPAVNPVEIKEPELGRPRDITLSIASPLPKVQEVLRVKGTVKPANAKVEVCVENSRGEIATQTATAANGVYALEWKRPPVNIGRENRVFARIAGAGGPRAASIAAPLFGFPAADAHVWLKVKGKDIVTAASSEGGERQFVPVGIGYCKDVIIPGQDEEVARFCKERGLNTLRLSFYTRFFNNRETEPIDIAAHLRDFVDPVVLAAKKHNLYVILDDHGYFTQKIDEAKARQEQTVPRWSEAGVADWIARWKKVAEHYKDEPTVLGYELMNEPHDITPEMTSEWYTRCLKAIRQVDKRHIVLVGSNDWTHARSLEKTWGATAATADAPHNNLVFAFHDYPEDNHPWIVQKHISGFRAKHNVPVLCTEFGATHWNKSETVCRTFIAGLVAACAKEDAGWMIWALKRLADNPRQPYNEVDKVGVEPRRMDSCSYSDIWIPAARVLATPFPKPGK